MKILRVKKTPLYDVFKDPTPDQDTGWLNWTRVLLKPNKIVYNTGNPLTHAELTTIFTVLTTSTPRG